VDEAESVGKGADSVVSMAHHYFGHHSFGEKHAKVHFDHSTGRRRTTPSFGMPCGEF